MGKATMKVFVTTKVYSTQHGLAMVKSRVSSLTSSVQTLFLPRWSNSFTFQLSLNVRQTSGLRVQEEFNDVDGDIHGASHSQRRQGRNGG